MSRKLGKRREKASLGKMLLLLVVLAAILAALIIILVTRGQDEASETSVGTLAGVGVVIDAGHGGFDVGSSGVNTNVNESDINLQISIKLQKRLEQLGAQVTMTRSDENALAGSKDEDMAKRREIIETSGQDVTISIHQNIYQDSNVTGPQVFYSPGSVMGEKLATAIQTSMNAQLEVETPRNAQAEAFYIVQSGSAPAVIVECGFLSSPVEEALLMNEEYQNRVVKSIIDGLQNYLAEMRESEGSDAV